jgi:hypothetical protein
MTTQFVHDCKKCSFLGHFYDEDVYYCEQSGRPTLLFRDGDEGHRYESYPYAVHRTLLTALSASEAPEKELMQLVKKLTLARLLADAAGLHKAEILVTVKVG